MKYLVLILLTSMLASCTSTATNNEFNVHRYRYYGQGEQRTDIITQINNVVELKDYIGKNSISSGIFDSQGNPVKPEFFNDMEKNYTDSFFKKNNILSIKINEGSGSIGHKITKIDSDGTIHLQRSVPNLLTWDMASWIIIVELTNKLKPEKWILKNVD